jgi:hypothetical protein
MRAWSRSTAPRGRSEASGCPASEAVGSDDQDLSEVVGSDGQGLSEAVGSDGEGLSEEAVRSTIEGHEMSFYPEDTNSEICELYCLTISEQFEAKILVKDDIAEKPWTKYL